jgi:hypothetical protein
LRRWAARPRQRPPGELHARQAFELLRELIEALVDVAKPFAGSFAKSFLAGGFAKLPTATGGLALRITAPFPTGTILPLIIITVPFPTETVLAVATVPVRAAGVLGLPIVVAETLAVFLSIILAAVLPPLTLRLAIEIGRRCRLAVPVVVWSDDAVEPFADRHAGSSRGFARSLA